MTRNREDEIVKASIAYVNEEFPEHEFVWNCFASGAKWADKNPMPEMVNKQEFIEKVKRWLKFETDWDWEYDEEGRNPNYGKIDKLVKYLEG